MSKNRLFYVLVAVIVLAVVGLTFREVLATGVVLRGDAERWVAIGDYYADKSVEAEHSELGWQADGARWTAMGEFYAAQSALESQALLRSRTADAARWQALGKSVMAEQNTLQVVRARSAAVSPRPDDAQRGLAAEAARWTAMGRYYTALQVQDALLLQRAREAYAARWAAIGAAWSK
jgi:hypothetical protein